MNTCEVSNYYNLVLSRLTNSIQDLYNKINSHYTKTYCGIDQLQNGSLTVTNDNILGSSLIFLTYKGVIEYSNPGILSITNQSNGTFTISSSSINDSSYVQWLVVNDLTNQGLPSGGTGVQVTTLNVNNTGPLNIQCIGDVTTGSYIIQRGFVWSSTNPLPTINETIVL